MLRKLMMLCMCVVLLLSCSPKPNTQDVITIPLVTWGGYAALFAANNGAEPTEDSLFYKYGKFKVKLVQEEDTASQLSGFAQGRYQMLWSTMDMLPILYDSLSKDSRTKPKVIGVFDYSSGGDGIIARGNIAKAEDLKGKKIVTSQYSPSHFFLLWYLNTAGLTSYDATIIFAQDAIKAKDTFINDRSMDACVTWSPFIYDITDSTKPTYVKGSTLLVSSLKDTEAYGHIADVYLTGAEFAKENPLIIEAFTKAMIEGYDLFNADKQKIAKMISLFFGIAGGEDEVMAMFGDVVIAGKVENKEFFTEDSPISGTNIYNLAVTLYSKVQDALPKDFSVPASEIIYSEPMLNALK